MAPEFVPGLQLAREFYTAAVRPVLEEQFPLLPYAAALLGPGSEVAGFDSQRSTDHNWGPRLQVFLSDSDAVRHAAPAAAMLARRLPGTFRGYPVAFPATWEPGGAARHRVVVTGLGPWLVSQLGFDPRRAVTVADWLATPAQRLAEFTSGAVFHDGPGELTRARDTLAWYPRDVWLYLLACQWQRIGQEEAFPGRCAEAGDDLGSVIVTARLARDLMRLCLLMHRRYPPYSKWLGSAFARLPGTAALAASLAAATCAGTWPAREKHLRAAYETIAAVHNQLELTQPLDTRTRPFHDRPYQVIGADRFTAALREAITDPLIGALPLTGATDQYIDSTDAAGDLRFLRACAGAALPLPPGTLVPGQHGKGETGARRTAQRNVALDPAQHLVPAQAQPLRDEPVRAHRHRILEDDLHLDRPRFVRPCRRGVQPPGLRPVQGEAVAPGEQRIQQPGRHQLRIVGVIAVEPGRIEGPDRRSLVHGELARPAAGHAPDQQPNIQQVAVGVHAEPALAGGGRLGPAVRAPQRQQRQPGPADDPGQHGMKLCRHDPSDLTRGRSRAASNAAWPGARAARQSRRNGRLNGERKKVSDLKSRRGHAVCPLSCLRGRRQPYGNAEGRLKPFSGGGSPVSLPPAREPGGVHLEM